MDPGSSADSGILLSGGSVSHSADTVSLEQKLDDSSGDRGEGTDETLLFWWQ